MQDLLRDLESPDKRLRLSASKKLRDFGEKQPDALYPHFERFAALLDDANNVLRWNAILTVGHLARADHAGAIDALLDRYLAPIRGPVMITAANTIKGAACIARAKPALAATIARAIMGVEKARYATPECRNVAIGHALQAFATIPVDARELRRFATRQVNNPRPATSKKAARLLTSLVSASRSRSRS